MTGAPPAAFTCLPPAGHRFDEDSVGRSLHLPQPAATRAPASTRPPHGGTGLSYVAFSPACAPLRASAGVDSNKTLHHRCNTTGHWYVAPVPFSGTRRGGRALATSNCHRRNFKFHATVTVCGDKRGGRSVRARATCGRSGAASRAPSDAPSPAQPTDLADGTGVTVGRHVREQQPTAASVAR